MAALSYPLSPDPAVAPSPPGSAQRAAARVAHLRWWRFAVLGLAGVYFLVPFASGLRYAFDRPDTRGVWFGNFSGIFSSDTSSPFSSAAILSLELAGVTVAIVLALVVPTTIYIHLRMPSLKRVMDGVTVLPIVIPPIVLIIGVLQTAPSFLKSTPYLLSLEYVMLAMPFVYRSLDAGLRSIDTKTLVEASRSLGAGWGSTLFRVLVPNLRTAILSGTVLSVAVVIGEYTMASLDQYTTFQVWIYGTSQDSVWISEAASMLAIVVTWGLLLGIVLLDRRPGRRRPGGGRGAAAATPIGGS
jgi:putative spermidine/putrescine transport system permease protein